MTVLYELVVPQGNYETPSGTKSKWLRCGTVFQNEKGKVSVLIEAIPTVVSTPGSDEKVPWKGWLNAFAPNEKSSLYSRSQEAEKSKPTRKPRKPRGKKPKEETVPF